MEFYNMKAFGEKLEQIRKQRGFSRDYINEVSGISKGALTNIEKGTSIPKLDTIHLLSIVLKVDLFNLFQSYKFNQSAQFYKVSRSTYKDIVEENIVNLNDKLHSYTDSVINETKRAQHLVEESVKRELAFYKVYSSYDYYREKDPEKSMTNIFQILEDIDYDFFGEKGVDYIDLRLAFLLSDLYRRTNQLEKALEYLKQVETQLPNSFISEGAENELKSLMYLSFATIYHRLGDYENVIFYAEKGINQSLVTEDLKFIYLLYFRKSIALYRTEDKDWRVYIEKCVSYLCITDQYSLCTYIMGVIERLYPEIHECVLKNEYLSREIERLKLMNQKTNNEKAL